MNDSINQKNTTAPSYCVSTMDARSEEGKEGLRYCITAERELPYSLDSYIVGAIAYDMLNALEADDVDKNIGEYVRLINALLGIKEESAARGVYYKLKKIAKNYIMRKGGFVESPDIVKIARECNEEVAAVDTPYRRHLEVKKMMDELMHEIATSPTSSGCFSLVLFVCCDILLCYLLALAQECKSESL